MRLFSILLISSYLLWKTKLLTIVMQQNLQKLYLQEHDGENRTTSCAPNLSIKDEVLVEPRATAYGGGKDASPSIIAKIAPLLPVHADRIAA